MLFYSRRKILNKAGRSSRRIIQAFTAHASSRLPKNKYDPLYNYINSDFSGGSYMLNPHELLKYAFKYSHKEVAEYICLASYRNYSEYELTKSKTLDLFHSPLNEDAINKNRLLRIKDGRIYFYYEEDIKRRNKIWH